MSNQVYAQPALKYFPLPGLNNYIVHADDSAEQTIGAGATVTIDYDTISLEQGSGLVSLSSAGILTFLGAGIYSIKAIVAFTTSANNVDPDMAAALVLTGGYGATGAALDRIYFRNPNVGSGTNPTYSFSLSYVGFFNAGDTVHVTATNNSASQDTVKNSQSSLIICKLI